MKQTYGCNNEDVPDQTWEIAINSSGGNNESDALGQSSNSLHEAFLCPCLCESGEESGHQLVKEYWLMWNPRLERSGAASTPTTLSLSRLPTLTLTRGGAAEPRSLAQTLVQIIFHKLNDKLGQW